MNRILYITWDDVAPNDPDDDICDHCGEELLGGTTVSVIGGSGGSVFWCEACQHIPSLAAEIDELKAMEVEEALE